LGNCGTACLGLPTGTKNLVVSKKGYCDNVIEIDVWAGETINVTIALSLYGTPTPIGPEGGIIKKDGILVIIPPGALTETTDITVTTLSPEYLPGRVVTEYTNPIKFSPDDLSFEKPVTIVMPLLKALPSNMKIPISVFHADTCLCEKFGDAMVSEDGRSLELQVSKLPCTFFVDIRERWDCYKIPNSDFYKSVPSNEKKTIGGCEHGAPGGPYQSGSWTFSGSVTIPIVPPLTFTISFSPGSTSCPCESKECLRHFVAVRGVGRVWGYAEKCRDTWGISPDKMQKKVTKKEAVQVCTPGGDEKCCEGWATEPDSDPCTLDECKDGNPHPPIDCDDGDPCTTDTCVDGECVNTPIPGCCPNTNMIAMIGSDTPPIEPPAGEARPPSYSVSGSLGPSDSASYTTPLGLSTSEAIFGIGWVGSDLNLILHSPDGITIDPSSNISLVYYVQNATCEYYKIQNPEPGTWTMDVKTLDVPESGENYTVFVYEEEGDDAVFNDIYSDYGTGAVGGLYERINVEVGVNATVPGLYKVNGSLYDANGNEAILVSKVTYLDVGNHSVTLKFYGMRQPGAYYLRNLSLYEVLNYGVVRALDHREEAYTTRVYHDLDLTPQLAMLTGHYADHGTDGDGDELYEFLTVDVGVNVILPGQYTLIGHLYDLNWSEVVWSIDHEIFEVGYHTMHLDFDGKTIEKHGVNGPYRLGNLFLTGRNWTVKDATLYAYNTSMYNSSDFVDPVRTEKVISGNGSGELALTVTVRDTAPVYSDRYSYDIVGINVPPISTPWNRTTPGYGYEFPGVSIPGMPNNYTVTAAGVENLNIGLKQLRGNSTRTWITTRIDATEDGRATTETDLISPGSYHVKIFGDAAEDVSQVDLTMTLVKKIVVNGRFNLSIDTTGFPSADYMITAKALNGSFNFDEIAFDGLLLAP
jgi:hypothetical protein